LGRALGIDYGDRRFGLAVSDPTGSIATPWKVIEGEAALFQELARFVPEAGIERIVLGLPINMDGTIGPKAKQVLAFKERLEKVQGAPVSTWDERLTTFQAHAALRQGGLSARQAAGKVDKVAAQILLQSYLDCERARGARDDEDDDDE